MPRRPHPAQVRRQRGAAALIVTMVLFFAMLLAAAYANRNLVFEQRSSANQYRSTLAFEAAEAGLEWALAQLNSPQRIGTDCRPDTAAGPDSFRQRLLRLATDGQSLSGATWSSAGQVLALQAACVKSEAGWSCDCPATGHPRPTLPTSTGTAPAFSVEFGAGDRPGVVRLVSRGCSSLAAPCLADAPLTADATARVEVALGLLPALISPPLAPLTARGLVQTDAALGAHNPDPSSGGFAVQAGAQVLAPNLRLSVPAGSALASAVAAEDGALAATSADRLFELHFGLNRNAWRRLPGVQAPDCSAPCGPALAAAIAGSGGAALLWVEGDASIEGPLVLGSAQQPIILIVGGALRLRGAVQIHGLVQAASAQWDEVAPGQALLRGGLISEAGFTGTGAPDLHYDAPLLAALKAGSGSFARVSGSWRDF